MTEINKLFQLMPPPEAVKYFQSLLSDFQDLNSFIQANYSHSLPVEVQGRGFKPVAVTLGGLMSIAGVVVTCLTSCEAIKYVITSPQVYNREKFFELSNDYMKVLEENSKQVVVVDFNTIPMYGEAEKLLKILDEGAVILQGVSAELAVWFGRNAGIGKLIIYRPIEGRGVFKYV